MTNDEIPTYPEALAMLADSARAGNVTAIVALERALRLSRDDHDSVDSAIDQILGGESD